MISQKSQVFDIRTKLQLSQVRAMLEISKVFNGSETFDTFQKAPPLNFKIQFAGNTIGTIDRVLFIDEKNINFQSHIGDLT